MFTATAILLVSRSGNSFPGESFGTAMKACYTAPGTTSCVPWPANKELVVFEHTFPTQLAATAVMNHFWCGGNWKVCSTLICSILIEVNKPLVFILYKSNVY